MDIYERVLLNYVIQNRKTTKAEISYVFFQIASFTEFDFLVIMVSFPLTSLN